MVGLEAKLHVVKKKDMAFERLESFYGAYEQFLASRSPEDLRVVRDQLLASMNALEEVSADALAVSDDLPGLIETVLAGDWENLCLLLSQAYADVRRFCTDFELSFYPPPANFLEHFQRVIAVSRPQLISSLRGKVAEFGLPTSGLDNPGPVIRVEPRPDSRAESRDCSLGWLHLSDLHQGMAGQSSLWPNVEEELQADLKRLHDKAGPWDLVLFTGDLVQRGSKEEFEQLDDTLGRLFDALDRLGSRPKFLAVPGNHDLKRPSGSSAVTHALRSPETHGLAAPCLLDPESDYRRVIADAFENYETWWRRCPHRPQSGVLAGLLPGEYSYSQEVGPYRVGVLALNSAFAQLTDGDYEGRLPLILEQFHRAAGGNGPAWARSHDANLLLTHHPPAWLAPESRAVLRAEIARPGRFAAHLYGHMHTQESVSQSYDGAAARLTLQACSLFGLESWGEAAGQRLHGYGAGRLTFSNGEVSISHWPRLARKHGSEGHLILGSNPGYELDEREAHKFSVQNRV